MTSASSASPDTADVCSHRTPIVVPVVLATAASARRLNVVPSVDVAIVSRTTVPSAPTRSRRTIRTGRPTACAVAARTWQLATYVVPAVALATVGAAAMLSLTE